MTTTKPMTNYVVFVGPPDAEVDLEPMKIYRVLPAESGDPEDYLRVVDESGEDYVYPGEPFEPIDVPQRVASALNPQ